MTRIRSIAFEDWPESDRRIWEDLVRTGGLLDEAGAFSGLREPSRVLLREHYSKWLAWLRASDGSAMEEHPVSRVTAERLDAWMKDRPDYAPYTRLIMVDAVLRLIQEHSPNNDWSRVNRFRSHLRQAAQRHQTKRKGGRMLSSQVLFDIASAHFTRKASINETPLASAKRKRDGILIAFLSMLPIRARAVSELALGTSVSLTPERVIVLLSGDMTKNRQSWETPVPVQLEPSLRTYIAVIRPWLMIKWQQNHSFLWVNDRGRPFAPNYLSRRVSMITEQLTGVKMPVHFFRYAAATTLARQSPANARLIRPLLGHLNFDIADQHYIQAQGIEAGRDYANALNAIKSGKKRQ